ncbi:alkaline phosphatase [Shewanella sp. Scap07]|uniref:alkaline phosphatase D family protein n=1 Tax=Shewanella sp. Scap07 TaxID=2589987 RepID=UPI0015B8B3CE|nr:alkaline phosphatase D family protein [Shewanella sp. Scap07]QLE84362.1 alkaline phosphatase [Shewanella sp. Scap07]
MKTIITRRDFLAMSAKGAGAAVISYGLMGCSSSDSDDEQVSASASFLHGVASGDPSHSAIILWTRVTPEQAADVTVSWEVATDAEFTDLVTNGEMTTTAARDYTVKVDAIGLNAGTTYYYRFKVAEVLSPTGITSTLPEGQVEQVKLAVFSCANYPAGHFNVYDLALQHDDIDAVVHLGDYLYEYARGEYASENAEQLNRQVLPEGELLELADYRTRYGQYRSDAALQQLHGKLPFITVWDDHEVCNDAWLDGAENHNEGEGDYQSRKSQALQAYFEWLPIRPWQEGNHQEIYRSFSFGDLVDLHMLDTRLLGRDKQLDYADYLDPNTGAIDAARFGQDVTSNDRTMLGAEQLQWLQAQLLTSTAKWQLLGQQVLMGQMLLPAAIATQQLSVTEFGELVALMQIAQRLEQNDPTVTTFEYTFYVENQHRLTPEAIALVQMPAIPYNLDAWDGYAYEREVILATAKSQQKNLVVIAGDTHNAWANELTDSHGDKVAVEFATSSVSSPGLEYYLGIEAEAQAQTEAGIVGLVDGLKYTNLRDRGFMVMTFTDAQVSADWHYVDTVLATDYREAMDKQVTAVTQAGDPSITLL